MGHSFSVHSDLAADTATLWSAAISPIDINAEFQPWLRMTFPEGLEDVTADWAPGKVQFRSWILLGSVIPCEYDDLSFIEVVPGQYFLERSSMLTQETWEHRRELESLAHGTRLRDIVNFVPRQQRLAPIYRHIFTWIFKWRHHNLRRRFGQIATGGQHARE